MSISHHAGRGVVHRAEFSDGLRLGLGTLTVLPTPAPRTVTPGSARVAAVAAPLLVVPIALAAAAVGWLGVRMGLPSIAGGLAAVGLLAWLSRGLHADGLSDTADGLAASWTDPVRALTVMRSGTAGPAGVTTLVVVLGLQAACLGALVERPWGVVGATLALAGSRAALALGASRGIPAARPDGLGVAFAGAVGRAGAVGVWVGVAAALTAAQAFSGRPWWGGLVATALGLAAASALLVRCVHRLGGITGDVLGALVEVTATALLVGLVAAG